MLIIRKNRALGPGAEALTLKGGVRTGWNSIPGPSLLVCGCLLEPGACYMGKNILKGILQGIKGKASLVALPHQGLKIGGKAVASRASPLVIPEAL